jgi:hypothetical protein
MRRTTTNFLNKLDDDRQWMRSDKKSSFGCWPGKLIKMSDLAEV